MLRAGNGRGRPAASRRRRPHGRRGRDDAAPFRVPRPVPRPLAPDLRPPLIMYGHSLSCLVL